MGKGVISDEMPSIQYVVNDIGVRNGRFADKKKQSGDMKRIEAIKDSARDCFAPAERILFSVC